MEVCRRAGLLQVEGPGLDPRQVLSGVLRHLYGGPRLPTGDHVPPHVQLGRWGRVLALLLRRQEGVVASRLLREGLLQNGGWAEEHG